MTGTNRWQQVKELFHSALELEPDERASFLHEASAGDEQLHQEVLSLIAAHESGETFLNTPAYELAAELFAYEEAEPLKGKLINHYRVLQKIGQGGMGEVYLAKDQKLGRNVALKILPSHLSALTDRLRRFEVEACAASGLNHPNILTIYEIGQADSRHYIATEYIEGETLRQYMPGEGMKIDEALDIAIQVASALAAAHSAGIVHRDIKPENIMIRRDHIAKVLDFGLAKLAGDGLLAPDGESPTRPMLKTDSGVVMGTVQYMSPEQARGLSVDARTDIWSLGCVLYEMVAGRVPFEGETSSHTIVSILEDETPPLKDLRPGAPDELEWIVMKALRKDRDGRYQTSKELLSDLKELKHKLEFNAELERSVSPKPSKEPAFSGRKDFEAQNDAANAETVRITPARTTSNYEILSRSLKRNWHWAMLAFVAPLLALALVFAGYKYWGAPKVEPVAQSNTNASGAPVSLKARQVTSWAGLDVFPSFSPDGNSIVYSSDHSGSFELYVQQLTPGGREIQLTSDGQQNLQPVWSPDGQRIAYHSIKRGGIWVIPSLGGAPKQLTDFGSRPAFSPDSSLIAFQSLATFDPQTNAPGVSPPSNIWVVPVVGGTPKQITKDGMPPGGHGAPCWSPDGRRLAFITVELGSIDAQLWTVNRDGSNPQPLIPNSKGRSAYDPVYAPDGKSIYFTSGTGNGNWGLVKLPVSPDTGQATGKAVVLKETGWAISKHNQISADGKRIVSSLDDMTSNLYSIQLTPQGEAAGAPQSLTQDTTFRKSCPAFSPDGKRIAYQKFTPGGNHDIWLMDADGKNQTQLTTDTGSEVFPSWLPTGDKVFFLYNSKNSRDGEITLRSIDVQTGREDVLLKPTLEVGFPQLSPDGKTVAFNSTENGVTNIWTISLDDGQPKQLTFSKDSVGFPHWSPDGQFIAFEKVGGDNSQVMIIPREGGEPVALTSGPGQRLTGGWSPDGTKISFDGYLDGVWNLWWITRDGKTQKRVTNNTKLNALIRYAMWSPLGNQIAFEFLEVKGNIWITYLE